MYDARAAVFQHPDRLAVERRREQLEVSTDLGKRAIGSGRPSAASRAPALGAGDRRTCLPSAVAVAWRAMTGSHASAETAADRPEAERGRDKRERQSGHDADRSSTRIRTPPA